MDTGGIGIDVIPYRYEARTSNRICWDDAEGAEDSLTLVDGSGAEVVRAEANGGCVTAMLPAGRYEMRQYDDGLSDDARPIFIQAIGRQRFGSCAVGPATP